MPLTLSPRLTLDMLTVRRYMQFHPLAYTVKLHIEMSMADLIGKIARDKHCGIIADGTFSSRLSNGTYHLEDIQGLDSQTRLAERGDRGSVSKPRRMFRSYSRRTGEYDRDDYPEPC